MFNKLIASLFPSFVQKKPDINYHYFETSRANDVSTSQQSLDIIQKESNKNLENDRLVTSSLNKKAEILSGYLEF